MVSHPLEHKAQGALEKGHRECKSQRWTSATKPYLPNTQCSCTHELTASVTKNTDLNKIKPAEITPWWGKEPMKSHHGQGRNPWSPTMVSERTHEVPLWSGKKPMKSHHGQGRIPWSTTMVREGAHEIPPWSRKEPMKPHHGQGRSSRSSTMAK